MAVQVVYDGPRVPLMRGFLRVLGVLFGAILLLAAICGLALTLLAPTPTSTPATSRPTERRWSGSPSPSCLGSGCCGC